MGNVHSLAASILLLTGLFAVEVATPVWHAASAVPDVLERPASISARASDSVLLAVRRTGRRLLTVGERGIVLFSDDDALSWRQARVPVSATLTSIHFATEKKGWSVGHSGVVLHTDDGGASWVRQLDGHQATRSMLESAQKDAIAHDDAKARRQLRDAQRLLREGPDKPFFDVAFIDEKRGFVVGAYGLFFATQDGGKTWFPWQAHIENATDRHLYGIKAFGESVYIAGEAGLLYRSTDAGQTFVELETPYQGSWFGVIPLSKEHIVVYGLRGNAYWSHDGGRHWSKIDTGTTASLTTGMALSDGSIVMATQAGEALRSTDQGRSFNALAITQPFPFFSVAQAANGDLVLSGARGLSRISLQQVRQ
ncbi:WD40/YVTN/BNR-like repeat-containing protein [Noviherbaspirillum sp.]|uniref:WD40/YVTN/BNR-like repeat-containing protein n=1 Tax=Noviherbaspirillum sp. TaxID=1926288 RepID=UPI002FE2D62E